MKFKMEVILISNSNWFHELFIQEAKAAKTTRENMSGSDPVVEALEVTENGTYLPPEGVDGFNPVEVNVASSGGSEMEEQFIRMIERNSSNPLTELPAGLTKIGPKAFAGHEYLEFTSLPAGVKIIESNAFDSCKNLDLTSLPDELTTIRSMAFQNCTNLALTSLPDGLTTIDQYVFYKCTNLALTSLPAGVKTICNYAFSNCTNLALTSLPDGVTRIENNTFAYCTNLALTSIPADVTSIGTNAFIDCSGITELTFNGKPTTIYSTAFKNCTNLLTINVPWAEGEVANAPWGATNATINYNYVATEYPFENGSRTFSAFYDSEASCDSTLTISGGNHINLVTASGTGNCNCNVSDISQNDETKINNTAVSTTKKPTKFSLKAGDVVRTVVTPSASHTESAWSLFFVTANGTATKDIASNSKMDNTITMDADLDVGCIGMWCQIAPADVIDMDVAIYVNDVRYV